MDRDIANTLTSAARYRHMSAGDLAALGADFVAYTKPVMIGGKRLYAIHSADGQELALVDSLDLAIASIQQHDMEPVNVH